MAPMADDTKTVGTEDSEELPTFKRDMGGLLTNE
jgi:hypothetical protein